MSSNFPCGSVHVTIIRITQWKGNDAISILVINFHCNYAMAYNFIIYDKIILKEVVINYIQNKVVQLPNNAIVK
jgi:hypothetical protein